MTPIEFVAYYEKYLIGDIDTMMEKADQESEGNQMAVPITFSIFSCLDIFGFLIRNEEKDPIKIEKEFKKNNTLNIVYAILKWNGFGFPEFDIQNVPNKSNNEILFRFIDIYRHGIMHTFFPKDFSISNKKVDESYELFYKAGDNLVFNARKFFLYFKDFIKEFKDQISSDKVFNNHIEVNINLVFKKDNSFSDFYENITKIEKFSYSYCPTATVETTPTPNQTINTDDMNITGSLG